MGRPLNKKYFGNRNIGSLSTITDNGIGGQGVASVTLGGTWAGFSAVTTTVTFSAPQLPTGVTATGTAIINGGGAVTGVNVTEKGSGYTSAPTVTISDPDPGPETTGTATAVLTVNTGAVSSVTNQEPAIVAHAKTTVAGTDKIADIVKQESSHRYLVRTADGIAQCKLVATTSISEGQMYITATDTTGSTYYVTKLTARKAILTRKTSAGAGWLFATGAVTGWTMGSPTATTVQVENALS
jgi:hypothetical protein